MRLHELIQLNEVSAFQERKLQETDWKHPREVRRWLESKGFQKKGIGSFAHAYIHPRYKRIVKISKRQDVCWLRFAYWTLKMTANPSVPYIDWIRVYGQDDKFFIAVVEKLAPYNRTAVMNTIDLPGLAYLYINETWFMSDVDIEDRFIKEGILDAKAKYSDVDEEDEYIVRKLKRYLKSAKGGKRFINALRAAEKRATGLCSYDMHEDNLMYRPSDRRLVVIDPLADLSEIGGGFTV